jgi:hypothetical protein
MRRPAASDAAISPAITAVSAVTRRSVGGGGNLLWGGSQNSFALQPLSLQGQTGVNVSGGVVGLDLEPVALQRYKKRHHRRHHH